MAEPVHAEQRRRYSRWASVAIAVLLVGAIAIIVVGWLGGVVPLLIGSCVYSEVQGEKATCGACNSSNILPLALL